MPANDMDGIRQRLAILTVAAEGLVFEMMGEAVIELLWAVSECREDFEELPPLIVEYGERLRHAAEEFDVVQLCADLATIFQSLAELHATKATRENVARLLPQTRRGRR